MTSSLGPAPGARPSSGGFLRRHLLAGSPAVSREWVIQIALLWFAGTIALAVTTWACFSLHVDLSTAGFALLFDVVVLSLFDSFLSSIFFSGLAAASLNYYFTAPIFSLQVLRPEDVLALVTFLITSIAITALVRRARRLGNAQREQAQLLDLTSDSIFVRNEDDTIRYWNNAAENLYGWTRAEAIGQSTHLLLKTVFPAPLETINKTLIQTGHWEGELTHTKRNGSQVAVDSRWSLQTDQNGTPIGTLETNTDITRRKVAEDTLRRSQAEYLAEAQKLSLTGSFGWNLATSVVFWSEQTFRIFEYDPATPVSIALVLERVHPDDSDAFRQALDKAAHAGGKLDTEIRLRMPDATIKHLHVVGHLMTDKPNSSQFVGAVMDVTASRQAEDRVRATEAELMSVSRLVVLGEFSASVAHEVGQPLAAIVTSAEAGLLWLDREAAEPDEVRSCLRGVVIHGKRASAIVQRIRTMTTGAAPQQAALLLGEVIDEVVVLLRRDIMHFGAVVRVDLEPHLPPVLADRIQLQQVMINLLMNGMQALSGAHDRSRELLIEARRSADDRIVVALQDSGAGIRPEHLDHLFDAFFTTKPNGMGMGLSICRSIIESHGGRVWASNNAGYGATFHFSLPAARMP